jgi:hypothetical protein
MDGDVLSYSKVGNLPKQEEASMESSASKSGNKILLWIAGGCLAILICGLVMFVSGFGGLYWLGSQVAEEVNINWDLPTGTEVDSNIEFRIAVTNITKASVELVDIDFTTGYLHGFLIDATTPLYTDTYQYPALGGGEVYQTYTFNQPIAPGETLTIAFHGIAVIRGDYTGTVAVCINSSFNCKTNVVRTIIK